MRVIFDTVGFVRGLISPRSRWGRILFDYAEDYRLIVSPEIVLEVQDVLSRPELVRLFSVLPGRDAAMVAMILQHAESIEPAMTLAISRDPKDDKFLATAKAAGVDYLVSEDRDLLVLKDYHGVPIIDAAAFIAMLERQVD